MNNATPGRCNNWIHKGYSKSQKPDKKRQVKHYFIRLFEMVFGFIISALGIVITIRANIGYAPWDVLNAGIVNTIGLTMGTVSIIVGAVIVITVAIFREKLGLGTVANVIVIGIFIDVFLAIIPKSQNMIVSIVMLIIGLYILSIGTYYNIKAAFGAGPRDSLMVVINRKTKIPIGICRSLLELSVTLIGWFLGGMVGIGTVISIVAIGFCIQTTFVAFKFDAKAVKHETLGDTFAILTRNIRKQ